MYEYFHGKLVEKSANHACIDVQGIGYKFYIPLNLAPKLSQVGEMAFLYVSWVIREMSQTLYGFATKEERDLFELLLTFSGIGPKTALGVIGHFEIAELDEVVRRENSTALAKVSGIGKKTAERLIIDLKGKLKCASLPKLTGNSGKITDALNALLHLGCPQTHAENAVKRALAELSDDCDLPSLITVALKYQKQ